MKAQRKLIKTNKVNTGSKISAARFLNSRFVQIEKLTSESDESRYLLSTIISQHNKAGEWKCFERIYLSAKAALLAYDVLSDLVNLEDFQETLAKQIADEEGTEVDI